MPLFLFANKNVVNFYNWADYVPNSVLAQFTKETGIMVNLSSFTGNDELYAKLMIANNHSGYDVIVPSSNYVDKMRLQGMLQKLDKRKLSNLHNLNRSFLNKAYDPHNNYSLPYLWGSTGIVINKRYFPNYTPQRWSDLWSTRFKNQLLLLDEPKSAFEIALRVLRLPSQTHASTEIEQAYLKLKKLLPNVKAFNIISPVTMMENGDVSVAVAYNGDANLAMQSNKNLRYIYPKDGVFIWTDCMAIAKNAPHLANAYKLMNFLMRPDIAVQIAQNVGYSSPNKTALQLMPASVRNNKTLYPSDTVLRTATFEKDYGKANALYQSYWLQLKLDA